MTVTPQVVTTDILNRYVRTALRMTMTAQSSSAPSRKEVEVLAVPSSSLTEDEEHKSSVASQLKDTLQ
jgi:hypothetical protein